MIAPDSQVVIRDFNGMVNAVDPRDLPPGAAFICVNATAVKVGELQVRGGLRPITYDVES